MRKVDGSGWMEVLLNSHIGVLESQIVLVGRRRTAWYMDQEVKICGMIFLAHGRHMASYVPRKFAPLVKHHSDIKKCHKTHNEYSSLFDIASGLYFHQIHLIISTSIIKAGRLTYASLRYSVHVII